MKKLSYILIIAVSIGLWANPGVAADMYVSDSFKITLRTGPSTDNKIISMLSSGQKVELLEGGEEWTHVRIAGGQMNGQEGWVLSRFLMSRVPWENQTEYLVRENGRLKEKVPLLNEKVKELNHQLREVTTTLKQQTKAHDQLKKTHTELQEGSAEYLKLKETYEVTNSALKQAQQNVTQLSEENKSLKSMLVIKWFLTGALVLLFGLMIGLVIGQKQKKSKSMLYSR